MNDQEEPSKIDADLTAELNPPSRPRVRLIPRDDRPQGQLPPQEQLPPPRRNRYEMSINGEPGWEKKPKTKVGYGSPPRHTQFQPGKSGNPLGRPKGSQNLRTSLEKIITDKISVRVDGKSIRVTRLEAVFMQNMNKALQGDYKAMQAIINTANSFGMLKERPKQLVFRNLDALSADELLALEKLLSKAYGVMEEI